MFKNHYSCWVEKPKLVSGNRGNIKQVYVSTNAIKWYSGIQQESLYLHHYRGIVES